MWVNRAMYYSDGKRKLVTTVRAYKNEMLDVSSKVTRDVISTYAPAPPGFRRTSFAYMESLYETYRVAEFLDEEV